MTRYFFIVGFPRSRTAWCSNLFTTGRVYCFHDAMRSVKNMPHLEEVVNDTRIDADYIGSSDNGLPLFPEALGWYLEHQDRLPIAVIQRPVDEVRTSLRKFHPDVSPRRLDELLERSLEGLKAIMLLPDVLCVPYSALNSPAALDEVWRHLIPDIPFDMQRAAALRGLHVELQQPWYDKGFSDAFVNEVQRMGGH